jgi:thiamine pyrophosphate-dependent acetolactate synthase large subunit-like protein
VSPLERAARLLIAAERPLVLVGSAARDAIDAVELLRARLQAPILTTPEAKSLVDETRPEAGGVFSFGASQRALDLVAAADLVVAVGSELGEFASRAGNAFHDKTLIQIVADAHDIATAVTPQAILVQDLTDASTALAALIPQVDRESAWFQAVGARSLLCLRAPRPATSARSVRVQESKVLAPSAAIAAIQSQLPKRARIACDVTSATLILLRDAALGPDQRLWCNLERSACMGGALSAGLGLHLASSLPTVVLIGDWGLMMGSSELHTISSLALRAFVVIVWSNGGGALIRAGVKAQGIDVSRELHSWRTPPDFVQVARGYGLRGISVRSPAALRRALKQAFLSPGPVLIEAVVDPHAEVPAGDRYLHLDASAEAGA